MAAFGSPGAGITFNTLADEYLDQWAGKDNIARKVIFWKNQFGDTTLVRDTLNRYADGDALLQLTDSQPINHKEIRILNPDNHLYGDAWIAIAFQSSQGLITSTLAASNGLVLRVATIMPFAAAVAAMYPSAVPIAKSEVLAFAINPLNDTGF